MTPWLEVFWCSNLHFVLQSQISAKEPGEGQGEVSPKCKTAMPLVDVAVDLISPCKVMVGGKDLPIKALTGFINICTTPYDYPH
jgi:hypothetical protein